MIHEQVTVLGAAIAVAYVSTIGSILWWMLHIPPSGGIEQHVSSVVRRAHRYARILVPVQGDWVSDKLVTLASQMAKYRGANLDVLYVIEVPLQLPLNASMPEQEENARSAFEKAAKIAHKYDVKINARIERARQAGPHIVRYARDSGVDFLMMGDTPKANRRGTKFAKTVEYVFEHAPCEVIIDRPPMDA